MFLARRVSLILPIFIFLLACPVSLFGQPLHEIRIGSSVLGFSSFPSYFARDRKFFEKEGLDAKMIYMQTNVGLAALSAGNVDYSNLATSAIEGTLRGLPLRLVAVTNAQPLWGLVVRKEIGKVADLKGKKIAVSSFGGTAYAAAVYVLRHYGLKPKEDVTLLPTGGTTERIAALKYGSVDAAIISAPGDIKAVGEGFKILLDTGSFYRLPNGGISTTVKKIRESPNEVRKVVHGVIRATRFLIDPQNREEVVTYIASAFKLDRNSADEFYRRIVPTLSPTGTVEMDKIRLVIESAVERGLTSQALEPERVVEFSFARELGS